MLGDPRDHPELFEFSPCHGHYHMKEAIHYTLSHGGDDTISLYDDAQGVFRVRNVNATIATEDVFALAPAGRGLLPIAGDWDADGTSTAGLYDPKTGRFRLTNAGHPSTAHAEIQFIWRPAKAPLLPVDGRLGRRRQGHDRPLSAGHRALLFAQRQLPRRGADCSRRPAQRAPGCPSPAIGTATMTMVLVSMTRRAAPSRSSRCHAARALSPSSSVRWECTPSSAIGIRMGSTPSAFTIPRPGRPCPCETATAPAIPTVSFHSRRSRSVRGRCRRLGLEDGAPLPTPGVKQAFCWVDFRRISGTSPGNSTLQPNQGITAGWADVYNRGLDCQWIDIRPARRELPARVRQRNASCRSPTTRTTPCV